MIFSVTVRPMKLVVWLHSVPKSALLVMGFVLAGFIAYCDWLTGYEINLFVFYAVPIGIVVWFSNRMFGIVLAAFSTVAWFVVYARALHHYSSPWIGYWDAGVRGTFFLFVAFTLPTIKLQLERNLREARVLNGLLPICNSCKKIRDASGSWINIETYICEHSEAEFNQKLCPDCARNVYVEGFRGKAPKLGLMPRLPD